MIITSRKQLRTHLENYPYVQEEIYSSQESAEEVIDQLVQLLSSGEDIAETGKPPDFGEDWEPWLMVNLQAYIVEALSIIA